MSGPGDAPYQRCLHATIQQTQQNRRFRPFTLFNQLAHVPAVRTFGRTLLSIEWTYTKVSCHMVIITIDFLRNHRTSKRAFLLHANEAHRRRTEARCWQHLSKFEEDFSELTEHLTVRLGKASTRFDKGFGELTERLTVKLRELWARFDEAFDNCKENRNRQSHSKKFLFLINH
jgi:hypothetical protein